MAIGFGIFLLLLGGLGIYHVGKIHHAADFFVAGRKASSWGVSSSLLATILGSSAILGAIDLAASQGWAVAWLMICGLLGLLALLPLASKVRRFGSFTFPELLGKFYGQKARQLASIMIPIAWLGIVAAQIIGAAKISTHFLSITYTQAVWLMGGIFTLYTIAGGQWSILLTDRIQFFLILIGLGYTAWICSQEVGIQVEGAAPFPFNQVFGGFDLLVLLLTYASTYAVGPDIYSRLFCAKDERTAQRATGLTILFLIPLSGIIAYLGVCAHALVPGPSDTTAFIRLIDTILPPWALVILALALLSAVMSSADTTLLTASAIVSDLFPGGLHNVKSIFRTRMIILVLGILSMFVALWIGEIITSLLLALSFFSGAFIVPMLWGLLGFSAKTAYALWAMLAGGIVALSGKLVAIHIQADWGNVIIIAAFLINALIMWSARIRKVQGNASKRSN